MTATTATAPAAGAKRSLGGRHQLGLVAAAATLLASAPLMSLYENWTWLVRSAFAVAMVAGAAAAARALRAPVWVQALAMLAALLVSLTWQFSSGEDFALLPTPATFEHFGVLFGEVPDAVASEAIPVSDQAGLLLLTTLGVGVVAILVDLAAVGLRRPAVAGLPMLAIYSVPVAVYAGSVPAYTFVIGAIGYLWLVGADNLDRVRRFGRRFTGDGRDVDVWEPSPLAAAGRRLTVIGALIAVLLPLAVPGMTTGLIDRFGPGIPGTGEGEGDGSPTSVNLFAALDGLLNRDVTEELVRFSTDDPDPYYLRVGVADQITERGFNHRDPEGGPVTDALPGPSVTEGPGVTLNRHRAAVEILGWNMNRAPVFSEPTAVTGLGDQWTYDSNQQVVFHPERRVTGSYEFEYARAEFDPAALAQAEPLPEDDPLRQELTEVPNVSEIEDLVAGLLESANNQYDQVMAIHNYFSRANDFQYSLETGRETTGRAIVDFAIVNKRGYCVQYATAMAWLVREAGWPARVAIGFTTGNRRTGDVYTLTNQNLHAWTEVYFAGFGWVPFDPTPGLSVPGSVNQPWAPDPDRPRPNPNGPNPGPGTVTPTPGNGQRDDLGPIQLDDSAGGGGGPLGSDRSTWPLWVAGAVAVVLAMLFLPALRRAQLRRRRIPREPAGVEVAPAAGTVSGEPAAAARHRAHAAWEELLDTMVDFQVPLDPAETPRLTSARLVRQCRLDAISDGAAEGARLLGQAEERARYARNPLAPAGLGTALQAIRRGLADQATRRTRLQAVLLPPSTLVRWRTGLGDATGRATAATNRIGEALARLSPRRVLRQN